MTRGGGAATEPAEHGSAERRLERRDRMLRAVEAPGGGKSLETLIQDLLDEGIATEELLEDLTELHALLPEDEEEAMLNVMDALTGWCAPSARLEPRHASPGDSPGSGLSRP